MDEFANTIENLILEAPAGWLTSSCELLRSFPASATAEFVLQRLPSTNNADLSFLMSNAVIQASARMSWEALSWAIESSAILHRRLQAKQSVELLWSGPSPANQIPARRIDQVIYDLINTAQHEVLLVTFAAYKVKHLTDALTAALQRGVKVRMILEFEEDSKGQLSKDAVNAFPAEILSLAEIYYWPIEKRELNAFGKPGKLHAKAAVIDGQALISSANLTEDAFNRNLELGALFVGGEAVENLKTHLDSLIASQILVRWKQG